MNMQTYERKNNRNRTPKHVMVEAVRMVVLEKQKCRKVSSDLAIPHCTLRRYCLKYEAELHRNAGTQDALHNLPAITYYGYYNNHFGFNHDQEKMLEEYLLEAAFLYFGLSYPQVQELAYDYAKVLTIDIPKNWFVNKQASKDWMIGFIKRHP